MVINKFPCFGIFTISFYFRPEWPDHLRMTYIAAFTDINIAAFQFKRGIRLYRRYGWDIRFNRKYRKKLYKTTNEDHHHCYKKEQGRFSLNNTVLFISAQ